jgi:ketosteroid isomerase-like protein
MLAGTRPVEPSTGFHLRGPDCRRALREKESDMSQENVNAVRSAYEAFGRGDVPAVLAAMDPAIVWNEAEGFPYADKNPYVGPDAVVAGVFARLAGEWNGWTLAIEEIHDAGDTVIARGRYRAEHKQTGKKIDAQFAHVWWLKNGKVVRFQQYTDTLQATRAMS